MFKILGEIIKAPIKIAETGVEVISGATRVAGRGVEGATKAVTKPVKQAIDDIFDD